MEESRNEKKKIWTYAVILFTSAFIVLLISAYSQIKLNNSLSKYKNEIYINVKEKSGYQLNLNSALEVNKKLNEKIKKLNNEMEILKNEIKNSNIKYTSLKNKYQTSIISYEALISAETEYKKGNVIACALLLFDKCDSKVLGKEAHNKYVLLVHNSFNKAAELLYYEGYKQYKHKNYSEAVKYFRQSLTLVPNEYYSDDCFYFIAYAQYKSGDADLSKRTIETFIARYPDSGYLDEIYNLQRKMQ